MENGMSTKVEHWPVPATTFWEAYVTGPRVVPVSPQIAIPPGICVGGVPEEVAQLINVADGIEEVAVGDAGLHPDILSEHGSLLLAWRVVGVRLVVSVALNDPK